MRKIVIGLAMASTALTAPAMAREGQWYIEGDAGVMLVEDVTLDVNGVTGDAVADHDTGADFGGIVGYAVPRMTGFDEITSRTMAIEVRGLIATNGKSRTGRGAGPVQP